MFVDMDVIRAAVWAHIRTSGEDFEETFAEACLACVEAAPSYDPQKSKPTTFAWRVIRNHLLNRVRHRSVVAKHEILLDEKTWTQLGTVAVEDEVLDRIGFLEILQSLSPDARFICFLVLNPPEDLNISELTPKQCRGEIVRYLRSIGWSWSRIWTTLSELKKCFA